MSLVGHSFILFRPIFDVIAGLALVIVILVVILVEVYLRYLHPKLAQEIGKCATKPEPSG